MAHTDSFLRRQIRATMRQRRTELSTLCQSQAAQDVLCHLQKLPQVKRAKRIAIYAAFNGELDTKPFIEYCWQSGIEVYLPRLHPVCIGHLLFLRYTPHTPMQVNRYGIADPVLDLRSVLPAQLLDLICVPLVAFDGNGQRLGMGGGFYDRTLASLAKINHAITTIGLAHNCQYVPHLPTADWDMPLQIIITPERVYSWLNKTEN